MILALALVIPEREVFECVRGDSMSASPGKELIDCAHQRKNDDLRCPASRRRDSGADNSETSASATTSAREQIVEVPIVMHFEQLVENPQF